MPVSPPAVRKLYCDDGNLVNVTDHKLPADIDIDFGESGGPLYDSTGNNCIAYGIVSLPADEGNCPGGRKYQHITAEALYEMFSHMGGVDMTYRLRGSHKVYPGPYAGGFEGVRSNPPFSAATPTF